MWEALEALLSGQFMPHGHCYLWSPGMVWLQVLSNLFIAIAYVSISSTLYYIIRKIRDVPFSWMYLAFGIFIVTCGMTHFLDVITIWHPVYWLDGGVRAVTAVASVGTALMLFPLVPKAVALANAAQLAHARGQKLESTYKELETAHARATALERAKTEFFANVSHELRTPLTLVLGPAQKLMDAPNLSPEQRSDLEVITRNAGVLLKHVNDLLDVAKIEAGHTKIAPARVDVSSLTSFVVHLFSSLARQRQIEIITDVQPRVVAEVDRDKLERVLVNVIGNAVKFTPDGGTVRCSMRGIEGDEERVRFEVADSGPGIPADMRKVVFERFSQVERGATRRFGGTGLGLAIAHDFVGLHQGRIWVEDAPGGGALVNIDVPARAPRGSVVADDDDAPATSTLTASIVADATHQDPRPALSDTPAASGGLVLVVEDNPEMSAFIADTLAGDYRVERAFDGDAGLEKALAIRPDAIITDMMMPKKSGDVLVREVRAHAELESTAIIVLTAKADDQLRVKLLSAGAQDYLMKPFSREELRARVRNLVTTKRAADVLRSELASRATDIATLANEAAGRKRDLESALETLGVAREQAESASQAKSSLLAMVSHEFRTPLATMQLLVDAISRATSGNERLDDKSKRMRVAITRLTELVDSLLEYARMQSGVLKIARERVDFAALVAETTDEMRPQIEAKGLDLELTVPREPIWLDTDPRLTRMVISNFLANAAKFTAKGGISIAVATPDSDVVFRITDTGPGISPADQARVFEPFAQLELGRHKHVPGIGLGLALVRNIVSALGGRISLSSEVGKGSTFEVRFARGSAASDEAR